MSKYILIEDSKAKRIHLGSCRRAKLALLNYSQRDITGGKTIWSTGPESVDFVGSVDGAIPATCCKPSRERIKAEATTARAAARFAKADGERAAADARIKDVRRTHLSIVENALSDTNPALAAHVGMGTSCPKSVIDAAIEAGVAARPPTRESEPKAGRKLKSTDPRYAEAMTLKKAGKRGAGVKLTDDELADHIRSMQVNDSAMTCAVALEIAYWVHKIAVSRARWDAAWDEMRDRLSKAS